MDTREFTDGPNDKECEQSETPSTSTSSDGSGDELADKFIASFNERRDPQTLLEAVVMVHQAWETKAARDPRWKVGSDDILCTDSTGSVGWLMCEHVAAQWYQLLDKPPEKDEFPFRMSHVKRIWVEFRKTREQVKAALMRRFPWSPD